MPLCIVWQYNKRPGEQPNMKLDNIYRWKNNGLSKCIMKNYSEVNRLKKMYGKKNDAIEFSLKKFDANWLKFSNTTNPYEMKPNELEGINRGISETILSLGAYLSVPYTIFTGEDRELID